MPHPETCLSDSTRKRKLHKFAARSFFAQGRPMWPLHSMSSLQPALSERQAGVRHPTPVHAFSTRSQVAGEHAKCARHRGRIWLFLFPLSAPQGNGNARSGGACRGAGSEGCVNGDLLGIRMRGCSGRGGLANGDGRYGHCRQRFKPVVEITTDIGYPWATRNAVLGFED